MDTTTGNKKRMTKRQKMWAAAAETEFNHGNVMAGMLFNLIAQPSAKEAEILRAGLERRA